MKVQLKLDESKFPPCLSVYVHGAPHRRQDRATLMRYRKALLDAADASGISYPITYPLDLFAVWIDPTSPDMDNSLTAFYRAVDSKSLKGPSLMSDDGLFSKVTMMNLFPNGEKK